MHTHAGAEHDFTRDIRRFRHLHHLAEDQLFNHFGGNFVARQHLPHHHFAEIDRRHAVKGGRLTDKWGS